MTRTLLAILHLVGAALFVVFMIARTAQAIDGAPVSSFDRPHTVAEVVQ